MRNATTYVIYGNSLSLETWGGFHVRRSPLGGELHRLTRDDANKLMRLPFAKRDTSTALTPAAPAPCVQQPSAEAQAAIEEVAKQFTTNERGQGDFGF